MHGEDPAICTLHCEPAAQFAASLCCRIRCVKAWPHSARRVQALESMVNNFKARQTECVHGKGMPGKYVMVEMWDQYAGLGNQFPSMITGEDYRHV